MGNSVGNKGGKKNLQYQNERQTGHEFHVLGLVPDKKHG